MLFDRMFDGVQTRSNIIKQVGQTVKCFITKQYLMMFGRQTFQTFPLWPGLNVNALRVKLKQTFCECERVYWNLSTLNTREHLTLATYLRTILSNSMHFI